VSLLLLYKLGTLLPGLSRPEIITHASATSIRTFIDNPLNGQYRLIVYGLDQLGHQGSLSLRLVSALFATITIWLFYYVASHWYERRIAIIGTTLFASSAWFLHYARLATPDITLTLLIAALAYGHWIRHTKRSALAGLFGIVLMAWLIYIPGLIWFVFLGGLWQRKQIAAHLKESKLSIPVICLLGVALLAPLSIAISRQPALLKPLVGLPANTLPNPYDIIRHILNVPVQLFFHGPANPVIWLGRVPLLDILAIAMSILGAYTYYKKRQLDRSKLLAAVLLFGTILIGLRGGVTMIFLTPFVYLLITAGIGYLLNQWLGVFPRNPLARIVGVSLIIIVVALSCLYNLRHYFVAWPHAPATKYSFRLKI
jgi:hypothetical protein